MPSYDIKQSFNSGYIPLYFTIQKALHFCDAFSLVINDIVICDFYSFSKND